MLGPVANASARARAITQATSPRPRTRPRRMSGDMRARFRTLFQDGCVDWLQLLGLLGRSRKLVGLERNQPTAPKVAAGSRAFRKLRNIFADPRNGGEVIALHVDIERTRSGIFE